MILFVQTTVFDESPSGGTQAAKEGDQRKQARALGKNHKTYPQDDGHGHHKRKCLEKLHLRYSSNVDNGFKAKAC